RMDPGESFYLYRADHVLGGRAGTTAGVLAAVALEPLGVGGIFPHERTMEGPKADRLELMRATRANLEPIWLVSSGGLEEIAALTEEALAREALGEVVDPEGVRHRLWALPPEDSGVADTARAVPLMIADGHHRYETALAYQRECRTREGPGAWESTLALISDLESSPPALLPIHRALTGVEFDRVRSLCDPEPFPGRLAALADHIRAKGPGTIGVAAEGRCWTISSTVTPDSAFLSWLFAPLHGEVSYEHDLARLGQRLDEGAVGFVLARVELETVVSAALAGERMPEKTTLFWPKPRSGMLMRDL
ncbi:MAG: DUF1015 family protein, partial [Acidimicrobiales bacterium]